MHQRLKGHEVAVGRQGRVLAQAVAGEHGVGGVDGAGGLHVAEGCQLHDGQGRLGELGGEQQAGGRRVGEGGGRVGHGGEDGCADQGLVAAVALGVRLLVVHVHVVLAQLAAAHAAKVHRHRRRVVAHHVQDGQAELGAEVGIGLVPHLARGRARLVQVHAHALLLAALAGEHDGRGRLAHQRFALQYLLAGAPARHGDGDDLLAVLPPHGRVREARLEPVARQHHADERHVVARDAPGLLAGHVALQRRPHRRRAVHAVGDGARQPGQGGEHGRRVDGVDVARRARIGLVGRRDGHVVGDRHSVAAAAQGYIVVEAPSARLPPQVRPHRVLAEDALLAMRDGADQLLLLLLLLPARAPVDTARDVDGAVDAAGLIGREAIEAELESALVQLWHGSVAARL